MVLCLYVRLPSVQLLGADACCSLRVGHYHNGRITPKPSGWERIILVLACPHRFSPLHLCQRQQARVC